MFPDRRSSSSLQVPFRVLLLAALVLLAGCAALPVGNGDTQSTMDLMVQNDGPGPVSFQLTVTDGDGATLVNESEHLDGDVGQSYSFTVATPGRHEVTVAGDDWQGQLAWNADTCARYDGTMRISDDGVSVAGECLEGH